MAPLDAEKRARLQAILEAEQAKSALAQKVRVVTRSLGFRFATVHDLRWKHSSFASQSCSFSFLDEEDDASPLLLCS